MADNTQDLKNFGRRELGLAAELLTAYSENKDNTKRFGYSDGIAVEFNPNSAMVFLVDSDCNVAVLDGDTLVDFLTCPECGHEGDPSDFKTHMSEECCQEYFKEYEET